MSTENNYAYALGLILGRSMKSQDLCDADLDWTEFTRAVKAYISGTDTDISMEDADKIVQSTMEQRAKAAAERGVEEQKKFFAENIKKEGMQQTESGVQYEIMQEGSGPKPEINSTVTTHYHGSLLNGVVFDSSVVRGTPAQFPVNGVIRGWQEILQMMPVGSKWRVFIPSALAYGSRGQGSIPANSALIFEIELISIDA